MTIAGMTAQEGSYLQDTNFSFGLPSILVRAALT